MPDNYIIQQPFNFHLDNLKQLHSLKKECDRALINKDIIAYSNSMDAFLISCYQFLTIEQAGINGLGPLVENIKNNPIELDEDHIIFNASLWFDLKELHKALTIYLKKNGISFANFSGKGGIQGQRAKHGLDKVKDGNHNND